MTDSSPRARPVRPATRRLWLVLVLIVGILGMHGLASDHASMAAAGRLPAAAGTAHGVSVMPEMAGTAMAAPAGGADSVVAAGAEPLGHPAMSMGGLCLAVLAGALLLLGAVRRQERGSRPREPLRAWLLARLRALPPPRPPDLVAELCVSRT